MFPRAATFRSGRSVSPRLNANTTHQRHISRAGIKSKYILQFRAPRQERQISNPSDILHDSCPRIIEKSAHPEKAPAAHPASCAISHSKIAIVLSRPVRDNSRSPILQRCGGPAFGNDESFVRESQWLDCPVAAWLFESPQRRVRKTFTGAKSQLTGFGYRTMQTNPRISAEMQV